MPINMEQGREFFSETTVRRCADVCATVAQEYDVPWSRRLSHLCVGPSKLFSS
jgi:hypothetical protein